MKTIRKSMFFPTTGIEKCSNYYLVQRLILQRIRSVLTGEEFKDTSYDLAAQYLTVPAHYQTPKDIERYLLSEAKMIASAFHQYEKTPGYEENIKLLRTYEGKTFSIVNVTMSGIIILIEAED